MPNVTVYCYLFSLMFYIMGYLKALAIKNAVSGHLAYYNLTFDVSMATVYFVLTIFLAVVGSYFLFLTYFSKDECRSQCKNKLKVNVQTPSHNIRRAS